MTSPNLRQVRRAAEQAASSLRKRDDMIRAAHEQGATIRAIATAIGLSSARVHQIIHHR